MMMKTKYVQHSSVTNMILDIKLCSFNTVMHNAKSAQVAHSVDNRILQAVNCSSSTNIYIVIYWHQWIMSDKELHLIFWRFWS